MNNDAHCPSCTCEDKETLDKIIDLLNNMIENQEITKDVLLLHKKQIDMLKNQIDWSH